MNLLLRLYQEKSGAFAVPIFKLVLCDGSQEKISELEDVYGTL
jgi:hypothetical protein